MASDYSYVKLCMTDLMIVNSGGAEVALSCRHFYFNNCVCVCVEGGGSHFSNTILYRFKKSFIVCSWMDRGQPPASLPVKQSLQNVQIHVTSYCCICCA